MARILVVEDSPTVVSAVEGVLWLDGHEVYVARDGLSALSSLRAFVPDLMLLDILLPHVDGFELCGMVRRIPAYLSMRIVMMSGLTDQASIQRACDVGADDYLTKPFSDDELRKIVEQHLSQPRVVVEATQNEEKLLPQNHLSKEESSGSEDTDHR